MKHTAPVAVRLAISLILLLVLVVGSGGNAATQTPAAKPAAIDREYILESTMLGYRGVGGDIDGVRNPTLWARTGESVRITIVNGELMVHDIALEGLNIKSPQILDKAARANITFTATKSDIYYCSVPGHRLAGMEGRLEVSDEPRVPSDGVPAEANGRALNLDFENGTLDGWTATGDAFAVVKGDVVPGQAPDKTGRKGERILGQQQHRGSCAQGNADIRTVSREPSVCQLPRVRRRVHEHARRARARAEQGDKEAKQVIFTISGANNADAAAGRRRPQVLCRQGHRRSARRRRDRGDGGRVSEGESLGAHQLRPLPLSRLEAVLPN